MNIFQLLIPKNEASFLTENTPVSAAITQLRTSGYTAIPVIREDGTYAGTVSEGDFLWAFTDDNERENTGKWLSTPVKMIMQIRRNPAVRTDVELAQLFSEALNQNFVPIVDDRDMFIGIVTRKQVITFLMDHLKSLL